MTYKNDHKTLLVLDIDETFIFATTQTLSTGAEVKVFHYHVYKRPFLEAFLEAVKEDFLLAIWSSASDDYVAAIVEQIIPKNIPLEFAWGRSRCSYQRNWQIEDCGHYHSNNSTHYHYVKPLKKLKKKGYRLERILIVDDSPHKSKRNYGNAIYPTPFLGDSTDKELPLLAQYLKTLKDMSNVRRIEKRNWQQVIAG